MAIVGVPSGITRLTKIGQPRRTSGIYRPVAHYPTSIGHPKHQLRDISLLNQHRGTVGQNLLPGYTFWSGLGSAS